MFESHLYPRDHGIRFRQFVQQVDAFALAIDLLLVCRKGKTMHEVVAYWRERDILRARWNEAFQFLLEEKLLVRTERKKRNEYGFFDGVYKSAPRAVDEVVHRLRNNGAPSWAADADVVRESEQDAACRAAHAKIAAALTATGYRGKHGRRLRAVG